MTFRLPSSADLHLLSHTLGACAIGVVISDAQREDHPIVYANRAFERLTGYTTGEVLGLNCRFLQRQDRDQAGLTEIRQAVAGGASTTATLRNYRKDGSLFYNELTLSPVHDASGTLTHYVGFQNDVTAREEARQQLTSTLERITDGVVSFDAHLNYIYLNAAAARIAGKRPEELIGRNMLMTFPDIVDSAVVQAIQQAKETGTAQTAVSYLEPFGKWIEITAYPSEDGVSVFTRDVTQQRQAEEERLANEARLREVAAELQRTLNLSLDMIMTSGPQARVINVNAASQRILGYTPEELIGRSFLELIHPEDRTAAYAEGAAMTQEAKAGRQATTVFQNRYLHKDGHTIWLEWNATIVPGDPQIYSVARDITDRKAAEEAQRASEARYRHVAAELQRTLDLSQDLITTSGLGGQDYQRQCSVWAHPGLHARRDDRPPPHRLRASR